MRKIRIAIVGVGNCASSLVQGINFYRGSSANGTGVGLMHKQIASYRPGDIEVVAAFDIDRRKVGLDVSKAIFAPPNCTQVFCDKVSLTGAIVKMGCVFDSFAPHIDRKSTRLNSSHGSISYAVFCLKKKTIFHFYTLHLISPIFPSEPVSSVQQSQLVLLYRA